jgi:hypothetical protein
MTLIPYKSIEKCGHFPSSSSKYVQGKMKEKNFYLSPFSSHDHIRERWSLKLEINLSHP